MPWEISFWKPLEVPDPDIYINDCCWGGDLVRDRLLPIIQGRFDDIQTEQEDWGWFIWFRNDGVRLAIDIFCDDPERCKFRILLTGRKKRPLLPDSIVDGPELDGLRELIQADLGAWGPVSLTLSASIPYGVERGFVYSSSSRRFVSHSLNCSLPDPDRAVQKTALRENASVRPIARWHFARRRANR